MSHFISRVQLAVSLTLLTVAGGCSEKASPKLTVPPGQASRASIDQKAKSTLAEARRGFVTKLTRPQPDAGPVPQPPADVFRLVKYRSPAGELSAYVSPDPVDGRKHPAIVWITGGDSNSIDEVWEPGPRDNDQTASAYRLAGMVMMFPSLRGGNDNPGKREGFLGEVDDILAATDFLASQPYVDASRIYLGGHSTGGTLVMLVAEMSDRYRAVFAFGPVDDVRSYGGRFIYHDGENPKEAELRSPGLWLDSVKAPLFVIEGTAGNISTFKQMQRSCTNPAVRFLPVEGADHFTVLAPANEAIAKKILADTGPTTTVTFTPQELADR